MTESTEIDKKILESLESYFKKRKRLPEYRIKDIINKYQDIPSSILVELKNQPAYVFNFQNSISIALILILFSLLTSYLPKIETTNYYQLGLIVTLGLLIGFFIYKTTISIRDEYFRLEEQWFLIQFIIKLKQKETMNEVKEFLMKTPTPSESGDPNL